MWKQVQPHSEGKGDRPCGREAWNNGFLHRGDLYVFGGVWARYGHPQGWADLSKMGVGDDLWRFDHASESWLELEPDIGSLDYGPGARRPGARFGGTFSAVGDRAYLFGGLSILAPEFLIKGVNDCWQYDIPGGFWKLIHPDNGWCQHLAEGGGDRPPIRGGHAAAAIGERLYIFGGWSGSVPLIYSNDLWELDTTTGQWQMLWPTVQLDQGAGCRAGSRCPRPRFGACLFAHAGSLYLFGGRDDEFLEREPARFFNDLWRFSVEEQRWHIVHPDTDAAEFPAARYAAGSAVAGDSFYLFGGGYSAPDTLDDDSLIGGKRNRDLDHLWRYHLPTGRWQQLQDHTGQTEYCGHRSRPSVRRGPLMGAGDGNLWLFSGLSLFVGSRDSGYPVVTNDIWKCLPETAVTAPPCPPGAAHPAGGARQRTAG